MLQAGFALSPLERASSIGGGLLSRETFRRSGTATVAADLVLPCQDNVRARCKLKVWQKHGAVYRGGGKSIFGSPSGKKT